MSARTIDPQVPMLTENALTVLKSRYLDRDESGVTETPWQLFNRVARAIAEADPVDQRGVWADKYLQLMLEGRFMPNSPTLMNAGRNKGVLSACFVLPVPDDTRAIFKSISDVAMIQKQGGGTGMAFDELRPCGAFVSSSGGKSSGPLAFWRVFSEATSAIQQGSFRRGANMAIMRADYPDIIKFLFAKQDLQQFTNYNISVKVSDAFMERLASSPTAPHLVEWSGKHWLLPRSLVALCRQKSQDGKTGKSHPRELDICYGLEDLIPCDAAGKPLSEDWDCSDVVTVGELFELITQNAWKTGEPGLFFIDRIRETEATPHIGRIGATNPCGEQPLMSNEACNLGSLNLSCYVMPFWRKYAYDHSAPLSPTQDTLISEAEMYDLVDWERLGHDTYLVTRFLDNVVDANFYPTPEIEKICRGNRKIGLGIMGLADALIALGVKYDSAAGMRWASRLMDFVNKNAIASSEKLAKERGAFPNFEGNVRWKTPMRNACVTTVAPTGTISIITNCSGGVEPLFSFVFIRKVLNGQRLLESHKYFEELGQKWGFMSEDLKEQMLAKGSLRDQNVPEAAQMLFRTAQDISGEGHIRMQGAIQEHVTSAVSKTVNLPNTASVDSVSEAYLLAWKLKCKGVTVYRDGCRAEQPMSLSTSEATHKQDQQAAPVSPFTTLSPLDDMMPSIRTRYESPYGNMHLHFSYEHTADNRYREREVFCQVGRNGDPRQSDFDALSRQASVILRLGGKMETVIDQLRGHNSAAERNLQTGAPTSAPNELAMALLDYYKKVALLRDTDGLLRVLPGTAEAAVAAAPRKPVGNNGHDKAKPNLRLMDSTLRWMNRVTQTAVNAGQRVRACQTPGCPGEVIHVEGCSKCLTCGESSCS